MATKKHLKKGKKYHKKKYGMRGGAIKITHEQIKRIVRTIYDQTIQHGRIVTNIVIANAVYQVLFQSMTTEHFSQLTNVSINLIIITLQFAFASLRLTATITSEVATQLTAVTNLATQTFWGAATAFSRVCTGNPIPTMILTSMATGALGALAITTDLRTTLNTAVQETTDLGLIESVSKITYTILIKTGLFEDEGYNPNPQNLINDIAQVAQELESISRDITPDPTSEGSQESQPYQEGNLIEDNIEGNLIEDNIGGPNSEDDVPNVEYDVPNFSQNDSTRIKRLLSQMQSAVNELVNNSTTTIEQVNSDLENVASDDGYTCENKRQRKSSYVGPYEADVESGVESNDDSDIPPLESDDDQAGGKKTKHRKRKHNKNKTKKIKHKKKHTKKHIKKHKKHTKKH